MHLSTNLEKIKGGILLRFLSEHIENQEHHPLVMGCHTLTPKYIRLSNILQITNPFIKRLLFEKP